jgi:hypothetical protein
MDEPAKRPAPVDERALLEELERIRDELHQARVQRQAVQDEFRRSVRGFKEPADPANATTGDARGGEPAILRPAAEKAPEPAPVAREGPPQRPDPARSMTAAPASTTAQEITSGPPRHEPPRASAGAPRVQPWTRVLAGGAEIVTTRRVWMRVLVDGERVLEREVPADRRVPLSPQYTIVIRTGDAGAVRLSIRGEDQGFLGREGEVLTRSFTVRPER